MGSLSAYANKDRQPYIKQMQNHSPVVTQNKNKKAMTTIQQ